MPVRLHVRLHTMSCWLVFAGCFMPIPTGAQTPAQWVQLGHQVHGDFGSYIALGIRIGLDARHRLHAEPHQMSVVYQDGPETPCSCVADGIMLATGATPGRDLIHVLSTKSSSQTFGIATIRVISSGQTLRYVIPASAEVLLNNDNKYSERTRYDKVMAAPARTMFDLTQVYRTGS
jgi:formylmethanofuran dehydrogenase subunit E